MKSPLGGDAWVRAHWQAPCEPLHTQGHKAHKHWPLQCLRKQTELLCSGMLDVH